MPSSCSVLELISGLLCLLPGSTPREARLEALPRHPEGDDSLPAEGRQQRGRPRPHQGEGSFPKRGWGEIMAVPRAVRGAPPHSIAEPGLSRLSTMPAGAVAWGPGGIPVHLGAQAQAWAVKAAAGLRVLLVGVCLGREEALGSLPWRGRVGLHIQFPAGTHAAQLQGGGEKPLCLPSPCTQVVQLLPMCIA